MKRTLLILVCLTVAMGLLSGCGMKFTWGEKYRCMFHHEELVNADKDLADAKARGADKDCPDLYQAVAKEIDNAYAVYYSCRTQEAIKMALAASEKAKALCPVVPKPVEVIPPKVEAPKVIDKIILMLNFDSDKAIIKDKDVPQLSKAIEFIKKHPGAKVKVEGHTDSTASLNYNQMLSEKRAAAVVEYFIEKGAVNKADISSAGYGKTKPIASNETAEGKAKNRRVEVLILSK